VISATCHFSLLPQHLGGLPNYVSDLPDSEVASRNVIYSQFEEFSYRVSPFVGSFATDRLPGEFLISLDDVFCLANFNPKLAFA
jgi:hypothetical protein